VYTSNNGTTLLSFSLSFGLKASLIPISIIQDVRNTLQNSSSGDFLPDGYTLTSEGLRVLVFQPNCKFIYFLSKYGIVTRQYQSHNVNVFIKRLHDILFITFLIFRSLLRTHVHTQMLFLTVSLFLT